MMDVNAFLNTPYTGALSTSYTPIPADPEGYLVRVEGGSIGENSAKDQPTKDGGLACIFDLYWTIIDEGKLLKVQEETGMEKPSLKQSFFCDVIRDKQTNEVKALDFGKGKNIELGKLREMFGQNDPKKPWNFKHLEGIMGRAKVEHRKSKEPGDDRVFAQIPKNGLVKA